MEILTSVITSSVVVGIFVFIFQASFKEKLNILSKRVDESISYRSKDFDQSFTAISSVWKSIVLLEDYIKFGFSGDIDRGKITSEPLRPLWLEIKQSMALLPDQIFIPTDEFLNKFADSWEKNCSEIISLANQVVENPQNREALKTQVNEKLKVFRQSLEKNMMELRGVYREYISQHFEKS